MVAGVNIYKYKTDHVSPLLKTLCSERPIYCCLLSVQFSSVTQSCPTLCDSMNRSTLGLPVHHQLPESTQTHVHRVSDAIQPSHLLSSPSPPAPNLSQHQSLFQRVNSSPKYWSFSFMYSKDIILSKIVNDTLNLKYNL